MPKINVNLYAIEDYENEPPSVPKKQTQNKPNSNPILSAVGGFRKAKMNVNSLITKDYRKKDDFVVRINKPNFQKTQNERKRFFTKGL